MLVFQVCSIFQCCFGHSVFCFRISLSVSTTIITNSCWNYDWNCFEPVAQFINNYHLNNIGFPNNRKLSLYSFRFSLNYPNNILYFKYRIFFINYLTFSPGYFMYWCYCKGLSFLFQFPIVCCSHINILDFSILTYVLQHCQIQWFILVNSFCKFHQTCNIDNFVACKWSQFYFFPFGVDIYVFFCSCLIALTITDTVWLCPH